MANTLGINVGCHCIKDGQEVFITEDEKTECSMCGRIITVDIS